MEKTILNFAKQFKFRPKIQNAEKLKPAENIIVAGMGGSALGAEIMKSVLPELNLTIWRHYGLPPLLSKTYHLSPKTLFVASSYSGSTEETLSAFETARKRKLNLAAITVGGKLLTLAKKYEVPYVRMPDTKIEPRLALGFNIRSLLKLMGEEQELKNTSGLVKTLNLQKAEKSGEALAETLWDQVPIIYASLENSALAYNWKIILNETGKIPAFFNVLPELNHNEMTGFDILKTTAGLSRNFHFIFLKDQSDSSHIRKRMTLCQKLYEQRGLPVTALKLEGRDRWQKIFNSILVANQAAIYLAKYYGAEPWAVPMVEKFKKLIR